jgi:hypothetical protein
MQRLSRLPPAPNVTLLDRRKPKSLSWPHANTTFTQQTYISSNLNPFRKEDGQYEVCFSGFPVVVC